MVGLADLGDFLGVGGDDEGVKLWAGSCGLVDPGEHGASGDVAEDLAGQAGGGESCRDDAEGGWPLRLDGLLLLKEVRKKLVCRALPGTWNQV